MSNRHGDTSASVAIAYIESLTARFENAEKHINDDIEAIEKRLQQLVELMKTVSTIQQQVSTQQEVLNEVRVAVRSNLDQLDELMSGIDAKYSNHFAIVSKKIADVVGEQTASRKKLDTRIGVVEEKLHNWLNRGIGMWAVFTLVVGMFQYMGMQYVSGLQQEKEQLQATVSKMAARVSDLEMRQQALERIQQRGYNQ
jgi:Mg2+ and Co2+ transporter CorA